MNDEYRELVMKDITARLPYGVRVRVSGDCFYDEREPYDTVLKIGNNLLCSLGKSAEVLPYLRPMDSMTERERLELLDSVGKGFLSPEAYDFLNSRMLDWRGLIGMRLAFTAQKGMYKFQDAGDVDVEVPSMREEIRKIVGTLSRYKLEGDKDLEPDKVLFTKTDVEYMLRHISEWKTREIAAVAKKLSDAGATGRNAFEKLVNASGKMDMQ